MPTQSNKITIEIERDQAERLVGLLHELGYSQPVHRPEALDDLSSPTPDEVQAEQNQTDLLQLYATIWYALNPLPSLEEMREYQEWSLDIDPDRNERHPGE